MFDRYKEIMREEFIAEEMSKDLIEKSKKRIIKFAPSFRESATKNLGLSEEEVRQIELDTIKRQANLREGLEG